MPMLPSNGVQRDVVGSQYSTEQLSISPSTTPLRSGIIDTSQDALILLKHYLSSVLPFFTPFRHLKTPWHVLFLPLVKNTFVGLALQEAVGEASLCVFYGILSIGASSLGGTSHAPIWHRKSEIYKHKACEHARASLQSAYEEPKQAKYKTQLMVLLTMAQMATVSGTRYEAEYFLLESERLIRLRGLGRRKSRKCRLLHHCYAYERIFYESTSTANGRSRNRRLRMEISTACAANSKDNISFRLPSLEHLEANMLTIKDRDKGEDDLHMQLPGI
ncbi:hypothetical protein CLAFUW4_06292 [Fulvia fulva]|uniref:Uncharacterized protein n=1 Tax=Passalora fulva TaxID=5499 RepID=A0A9Q8LIY9_PASFU|nr:uncharacterized protein CLAFUR5_06435 [Fulvia fulva]KAK4624179.1 hypothetical protein CLAFUR4_06295 [Fulvia fulva]KAK4624990.1 hypothetical protein CLAFUR0_06299 [Fulvia fulva]UJO18350.1 hypothetical protein CLAFUR5_06435 [Fulvia fulva]WPV15583.1 hypothetical protein CLAFUW4_06292 [Fulvia fulva]WPV30516.1 hypothetical protein CLAFUW7_06288 [Fulvia fulva]